MKRKILLVTILFIICSCLTPSAPKETSIYLNEEKFIKYYEKGAEGKTMKTFIYEKENGKLFFTKTNFSNNTKIHYWTYNNKKLSEYLEKQERLRRNYQQNQTLD